MTAVVTRTTARPVWYAVAVTPLLRRLIAHHNTSPGQPLAHPWPHLLAASVPRRADIWIAVRLPGQADPVGRIGPVTVSRSSIANDSTKITHVQEAQATSRPPTRCRVLSQTR
jgi:hypothetical protein